MNEHLVKIKRLVERIIRIQKEKEQIENLSFSIIPSCEIVLKEISQLESGQRIEPEQYSYIPQVGGIYRHYKGQLYTVEAIAFESVTIKPVVVYRSLENSAIWVRSLASFTEVLGDRTTQYYRFQAQKSRPSEDG